MISLWIFEEVDHDLILGEEEEKFEEGSGSSDEDTMEEDCYECKVIVDIKKYLLKEWLF